MKEYWLNKNYRWFVPVATIMIIAIYLLATSGLGRISSDLAQAYADKSLYKDAIKKVNDDSRVISLLGKIKPIDKMTILNGEVRYENEHQDVTSTIKVQGSKGDAKLDLHATRMGEKWEYRLLHIRINKPVENVQIIEIIPEK